ncbi:MAG TPA: hypothetical protein VE621_22775 [Bryobacteraceae bacterium]|jgi:anti-sigma factor RsiW|nr:hypothetical protein [Bryobacteraceae bacterium]
MDLRDYLFGEGSASERQTAERHIVECSSCAEEFEELRLTKAALLTVRDEEPPRRIAFVSDKVFEPNWWQKLWNSGARLGFVSAGMLSAALVFHAIATKPQPQAPAVQAQQIDPKRVENEVARRVEAVVAQRMLEMERKQQEQLALISAQQKRMEFNHKADLVTLGESFNMLQKRMGYMYRASNDGTGAGQ